jgi:hypothetical protein
MRIKILVMVGFIAFFVAHLSAQNVSNESNSKTYQFCELIVPDGFLFNSPVDVDYGQAVKWRSKRRLTDGNGVVLKFKSVVDAINYMSEQGWDYFQVYSTQISSSTSEAHYVFRKSADKELLISTK